MNGVFDSEIHFVSVTNFASEFDLLGAFGWRIGHSSSTLHRLRSLGPGST